MLLGAKKLSTLLDNCFWK